MSKFMKFLQIAALLTIILVTILGAVNEVNEIQEREAQRECWYYDRPHYAIIEGVIWCSVTVDGMDYTDTLENIKMYYGAPDLRPRPQ